MPTNKRSNRAKNIFLQAWTYGQGLAAGERLCRAEGMNRKAIQEGKELAKRQLREIQVYHKNMLNDTREARENLVMTHGVTYNT